MYVVYISAIWPLLVLVSLYKNYFQFIKIQFSYIVKICFQMRTKNHLESNMRNSHKLIIQKKIWKTVRETVRETVEIMMYSISLN